MMFRINKNGHVPEEKLKEQMDAMFKTNGVDMPMELLEYARKLTNVFFKFIHEGLFCKDCKRKLYEAVEKE